MFICEKFSNFATEGLSRKKTNKLFCLENTLNFTHEFFNDNFNKKIKKNFLLKLSYKNPCVKFNTFSRKNGSFVSSKRGAQRQLYETTSTLASFYLQKLNNYMKPLAH